MMIKLIDIVREHRNHLHWFTIDEDGLMYVSDEKPVTYEQTWIPVTANETFVLIGYYDYPVSDFTKCIVDLRTIKIK